MVNLSTFQQYLSIDARLSRTLTKSIDLTKSFNKDEQHLLKWAALLPMQTEAQPRPESASANRRGELDSRKR